MTPLWVSILAAFVAAVTVAVLLYAAAAYHQARRGRHHIKRVGRWPK